MGRTRKINKQRHLVQSQIVPKRTALPLHADSGPTGSAWKTYVICILLTVVTAAIYSPVASYPFINYDDPDYVSQNLQVQAGLSWQTVTWAATATNVSSNWHPLTLLSHALDCQLYGLDAGGHHLSNLLFHVCNVLLLFLLLAHVTRAVGRSAMVAGLFALHPFNVGTVAWIAERKNVLSAFFFFLALAAYSWYVQRPGWKRYAVLAFLFAMGLASKPMVITLPFVLLLLDYWPLGRIRDWTSPSAAFPLEQLPWPRLLLEKLPLFLLAAASAVITVVVQRAGHAIEPLGYLPLTWRIENALYSYATYLAKIFWPVDFALAYPHPLGTLRFVQIVVPVFLLVSVSVFVWKQRIRRGYALTGWLWFLGTLVPVIGIIQVGGQGMADRYAYLPTIGIFLILVWGCADWSKSIALDSRVITGIAVLVLAGLSVVTFREVGYWRSSGDLWKHTLESTRNNFIADDGMADVLLHEGSMEALGYYEAAAKIAPWDPISHAAVAANLQDQGKLQNAIREYQIALRAEPSSRVQAHIYADLGALYRGLGDYAHAEEDSRRALRLDPQQVHEQVENLSQLVAAHPAAVGYWRLGLMLEGTNQISEARSAYGNALLLNPQFSPARAALQALDAAQR
jgi:protein O-mannosyl-transferase